MDEVALEVLGQAALFTLPVILLLFVLFKRKRLPGLVLVFFAGFSYLFMISAVFFFYPLYIKNAYVMRNDTTFEDIAGPSLYYYKDSLLEDDWNDFYKEIAWMSVFKVGGWSVKDEESVKSSFLENGKKGNIYASKDIMYELSEEYKEKTPVQKLPANFSIPKTPIPIIIIPLSQRLFIMQSILFPNTKPDLLMKESEGKERILITYDYGRSGYLIWTKGPKPPFWPEEANYLFQDHSRDSTQGLGAKITLIYEKENNIYLIRLRSGWGGKGCNSLIGLVQEAVPEVFEIYHPADKDVENIIETVLAYAAGLDCGRDSDFTLRQRRIVLELAQKSKYWSDKEMAEKSLYYIDR